MGAEGNADHSPVTETTLPSSLWHFFFGGIYQPCLDIFTYLLTPVSLPRTMYLDVV
jgi:hypothetical protein